VANVMQRRVGPDTAYAIFAHTASLFPLLRLPHQTGRNILVACGWSMRLAALASASDHEQVPVSILSDPAPRCTCDHWRRRGAVATSYSTHRCFDRAGELERAIDVAKVAALVGEVHGEGRGAAAQDPGEPESARR
jgi:hypothetical protein